MLAYLLVLQTAGRTAGNGVAPVVKRTIVNFFAFLYATRDFGKGRGRKITFASQRRFRVRWIRTVQLDEHAVAFS